MELSITDYNGAEELIKESYSAEWLEVRNALYDMPLHLKASDQNGKQGDPIFDPVGTNCYIKNRLQETEWIPNQRIPEEYRFLGKDIDFVKSGVLIEVQFSNYPFLLNNLLRSELFFKSQTKFTSRQPDLLIIITKANSLPSSNSTLYFEQAEEQLGSLIKNNIFDIPIRLVGLMPTLSSRVDCIWTTYESSRYSRSIQSSGYILVDISMGRTKIRISRH